MARKNRVSVYDGIYHVTSRIANRAMLLAEDAVKDKIMEWIVSVADFSGVEVWAFCIMENHLHLFVRVPPVPERYWLDPNDEPCAYAFGMRPPECREPLWSSAGDRPPSSCGDCPPSQSGESHGGDCPRSHGSRSHGGDCPQSRRPPLDFMLDDEEMVGRLARLYGEERAAAIGRAWESLRSRGIDRIVDREKERYCRCMYNLSQFVKTLKERVSTWYNAEYGHTGTLWEGRFYSGVVEKDAVVKAVVAAYIGYNPVKATIAQTPTEWKWSSYALAVADGGSAGERCRRMYEKMLGRPWEEVRETLESMYADKLPDTLDPKTLKEWYDDYDSEECNNEHSGEVYRASQAIRATMELFSGAFIGRDKKFFRRAVSGLPEKFPKAGTRSVRRCCAFRWEMPPTLLKKAA